MYLRAKGDQKADAKGGERDGLRAEAAALFAEEGKMWDGDMRDRLVRDHALQGYLVRKKTYFPRTLPQAYA